MVVVAAAAAAAREQVGDSTGCGRCRRARRCIRGGEDVAACWRRGFIPGRTRGILNWRRGWFYGAFLSLSVGTVMGAEVRLAATMRCLRLEGQLETPSKISTTQTVSTLSSGVEIRMIK